jgi:hypothetical protein
MFFVSISAKKAQKSCWTFFNFSYTDILRLHFFNLGKKIYLWRGGGVAVLQNTFSERRRKYTMKKFEKLEVFQFTYIALLYFSTPYSRSTSNIDPL